MDSVNLKQKTNAELQKSESILAFLSIQFHGITFLLVEEHEKLIPMVLEKAKEWAINNLVDDETIALLLVGAWARGEGTDVNDIDVVQIKQYQLVAISHIEFPADGFVIDCWVHDKDAMIYEMSVDPIDSNAITTLSITLRFLKDAIIWFEREPFIVEELRQRASEWKWNTELVKLLQFEAEEPETNWARNAFHENMEFLEKARQKLLNGEPVTHRRKDYPEINQNYDKETATKLWEATRKAYENLGIQRDWPEFKDAEKALNHENWKNAVASLKDVLRFIIRYELPSVPDQLLDPKIWKYAEQVHLSEDTLNALKLAYDY